RVRLSAVPLRHRRHRRADARCLRRNVDEATLREGPLRRSGRAFAALTTGIDSNGMNRRALLIALIIGIVGVFLLLLYQRRFELEASGGEKVKLLIAVKRLERGKPITEDMIAVREVPVAYVDDRGVREVDKSKILGLRVGATVKEQNLVLWSDLTTG